MLLEAQKYFRSKKSQTKVIEQKGTQILHSVYFPTRHKTSRLIPLPPSEKHLTSLDCDDNMRFISQCSALLQQNFAVWITSSQAKIRL
jgi:hypothetical protein